MKLIQVLSFFTITFTAQAADYAIDLTKSISITPVYQLADNSNSTLAAISIKRYSEGGNVYIYANHGFISKSKGTTNNSTKKSNIFAAGAGYKTTGKIYLQTSLGIAIIDKTGSSLTGHKQFRVFAGGGVNISDDISVGFGVTHYSNCAQICNRSAKYYPNQGLDYAGFNVEIRL